MEKIDFKKTEKILYAPSTKTWQEVTVPEMTFLMIDGEGDPNSSLDYQEAIQALYAISYAAKFYSKKKLERDYTVLPLEGLWSADDYTVFQSRDKEKFQWTMMIRQPDWLGPDDLHEVCQQAEAKKPGLPYGKIRISQYAEGLSLQLLHIGSYDDEAPKLAQLHQEIMPADGFTYNGLHHEIYLSDPRKVSSDKLKTILRQPVKRR